MKKQISLFLSLMLAVSCASESKEVGQEIHALDEAIADKVVYRQNYEIKMKILKRRLREARSDGERWTLIRQCYLEYKTYDVDSAAHYVKEMEALARRTGDKDLLLQAAVARVTVNHAQYLYDEGRLLFESLDTAGTSRTSQAGYLSLGIRLYRDHLKYLDGGVLHKTTTATGWKNCETPMPLFLMSIGTPASRWRFPASTGNSWTGPRRF